MCLRAIFFIAVLTLLPSQLRADTYSDGWGPEIGSQFPEFVLKSHEREEIGPGDLMQERGMLLFFNRSVVW